MRELLASRYVQLRGVRRLVRVALLFEPRDLWVGLYWNRWRYGVDVYGCLIPTLPVKLTIRRGPWAGGRDA